MRNIFLDQIVNDNLAAVHPSQSITPLGPKPSRVDHRRAQRRRAATKSRNISRKGAKAAKKLNFRTGVPFDFAQDMLGVLARE